MAALTISAVNFSTGNLTVTAHGLNTGDGPGAVFVGAGGVIPTGLAPVTDYWIYVVDPNTVRLCDSSAHALAGVSVSFSTNGTLPLSLLVGIPYRRARTYVALTQIKSADLDALQDNATALWNLLSGQAQSIFASVNLAVGLNANAGITVPTGQNIVLSGAAALKKGTRTRSFHPHQLLAMGSASQAPTYQQSINTNLRTDFVTSSSNIAAGLAINGLDVGDRILNVRVYLKDVSGQPALTARLIGGDRAGSGAVNAVSASSAASGATQTVTLTAVNHTIGTTSVGPVYVHLSTLTNATGTYSVFAVEIDYDTP